MNKLLAFANLVLTFVLIALGAFAKNEINGLECASWPLCYGRSGELLFESYPMVHRAVAGLVILLHGILFFKIKKDDSPKKFFLNLGLVLLIIQSILGAVSSIYKFPTIMNTTHLFLSVAYFVVFARFVFALFDHNQLKIHFSTNQKDLLAGVIILCFIQLIIGSVLNHSTPRSICGGAGNLFMCNGYEYWPELVSAKLHMVHRFLGVAIFLIIGAYFITSFKVIKLYANSGDTKFVVLSGSLFFTTIFHYFYTKYLFLYVNEAWPVVAHLTFALLMITVSYLLLDYKRFIELSSLGSSRHTTLSDMLELTKPRLGLLVVATMLTGVLISAEFVNFFSLSFALLLSTLVVASATTLNCLIELKVDSQMERTRDRALPSGRLSPRIALIQGVVLILISIPGLYFLVNWETALLGFIAFTSYLFAYTPMKRKTPFALYVGALPGAIPPVMGRTIVVGDFDLISLFLFIVLFIWQVPHFLAISIYHKEDYRKGGIKVYPHYYSDLKLLIVILVTTVMLAVSAIMPYFYNLADKAFLYSNLVLGVVFVLLSIFGFFAREEEMFERWARKYFWGSIIYLPLVMLTFIFFS